MNPLPHPREYRDPAFLELVDDIHAVITELHLPDERRPRPAPPGPHLEPLPAVSVNEIVGLLEVVHDRGDRIDLFKLAAGLRLDLGHSILVVKAAELLDLVNTPKQDVLITPLGREFIASNETGRKRIFHRQVARVPTFAFLVDRLRHAPVARLPAYVVQEDLANSMMSMAGGWFFLTVTEAFTLGDHDFRLPGIGSYMSVAIDHGDVRAMAAAAVAMIVMIVAVDQLVWRPALAWAQKFKLEESEASEGATSWALDLLRRSRVIPWAEERAGRLFARLERRRPTGPSSDASALAGRGLGTAVGIGVGLLAVWGALHLATLLMALRRADWLRLSGALGLTFLRTAAALGLGALWTVPVGIWIGLSPRRMRILQPVIQVAAPMNGVVAA